MKTFLRIFLCLTAFFGFNSPLFAAMEDYCQSPPFLATTAKPNIMMTIDASGSMAWCGYNPKADKTVCCNTAGGCGWTFKGTEEGYFRPDILYQYNAGAAQWEETAAGAATACPGRESDISTANKYMGACLNFNYMSRTDLVRWAMTGGTPASCTGTKTFNKSECDPELWGQPGNGGKVGSVCNDTIGGCILLTSKGIQVKVPWSRMNDSLASQFKTLSIQPRMGAMFYSDTNVRADGQVFMGDFTAPNSTSTTFPYINLITAINSTAPAGGTPTGPAMVDTLNYFRQTATQYDGLPVQSGDGDRWKNPMYVCDGGGANCILTSCAKNFVILMSDGSWNSPGCSIDTANADPVKPAYVMHTGFTNAATNIATNVSSVYAIGLFMGGTGLQSLKNTAMYGSFNTSGRTWPGSLGGYPDDTCVMDDCGNGKGSGCENLPASSPDWDANADNIPDTFYNASDAAGIKQTIKDAVMDALKKASSGTAVSVLSSGGKSGANLMQALFYPKRLFASGTELSWTSDLMNYWYYMDPYFTYSQIREDTVREGAVDADATSDAYTLLDLKQDYVTQFKYSDIQKKTLAERWQDTTGKGAPLTAKPEVAIEEAIPVWRAGFNLWWTDPAVRNIKTSINGSTLIDFTTDNYAALDDYLEQTASVAAAKKTINYVRGYDYATAAGEYKTATPVTCAEGVAGCFQIGRNRTVAAKVCSARRTPCNSDADCPGAGIGSCVSETHVWKMGDIISSTPRIMGPGNLHPFHIPAPVGYNDQTYKNFLASNDYKNRDTVFVGANDGMLHAFKIGKILNDWSGRKWYEVARIEGVPGAGGVGSEKYAFIPKNALPYLQHLYNVDYCHINMVDGPIAVADAPINKPSTCTLPDYWDCPKLTTTSLCSITTTKACNTFADCPSGESCISTGNVDFAKTSWRTTLIGSMGIGGATCAAADADRIKTPFSVSGNPAGWSSYFALDVTDQATPQLLWEFTNADLGVTNVGPAIIKIGGNDKRCATSNDVCTTDLQCAPVLTKGSCVNTNGRSFAILASGATGPITSLEFKGTSDQNLRLFILDLKTGALLRTIDTGIANAFAGSISSGTLDLERDKSSNSGNYQDDVLYIGYVKGTTNGGVLRLVINDDLNFENWKVSSVIENIGPVTTSVANLIDRRNGKLWLYFAEGRYHYKADDLTNQRKLFGIEEPCFDAANNSISPDCITKRTLLELKDQTTTPSAALTGAQKGWYINLNAAASPLSAERVISNPTATILGAIYFLSFAPSDDICALGGKTYLWAFDYKTGSKVTFIMQGKALVQVSTGEVKELKLSEVFTQNDNRKTDGFFGVPPVGEGLVITTNPPPLKKLMHVQER